jgi:hypothetical protein
MDRSRLHAYYAPQVLQSLQDQTANGLVFIMLCEMRKLLRVLVIRCREHLTQMCNCRLCVLQRNLLPGPYSVTQHQMLITWLTNARYCMKAMNIRGMPLFTYLNFFHVATSSQHLHGQHLHYWQLENSFRTKSTKLAIMVLSGSGTSTPLISSTLHMPPFLTYVSPN